MIIDEIKHHIKYGCVDPSFSGRWYDGLSDGTIKILMNKGLTIRRKSVTL